MNKNKFLKDEFIYLKENFLNWTQYHRCIFYNEI